MRFYIGNLSSSVTDEALEEVFSKFGQVTIAHVVTDRRTGKSHGFGLVEVASDRNAWEVAELLKANAVGGAKPRHKTFSIYPIPDDTERTIRQSALVDALTGGQAYSSDKATALELENRVQQFEDRRGLLSGALTSSQVAALLGTSRQTPHDRAGNGSLLALRDNGRLLFPPWQFDPNGPDGVVRGLPSVIEALMVNSFAQARWLTRPNHTFEGQAPIEVLRSGGDIERVANAARTVGVS